MGYFFEEVWVVISNSFFVFFWGFWSYGKFSKFTKVNKLLFTKVNKLLKVICGHLESRLYGVVSGVSK